MNNQDTKQSIQIAKLETKMDIATESITTMTKRFDDFINSSNKDKETQKIYMDEKYISKDKFEPYRKMLDKINNVLWGAFATIGLLMVGAIMFFKEKLGL